MKVTCRLSNEGICKTDCYCAAIEWKRRDRFLAGPSISKRTLILNPNGNDFNSVFICMLKPNTKKKSNGICLNTWYVVCASKTNATQNDANLRWTIYLKLDYCFLFRPSTKYQNNSTPFHCCWFSFASFYFYYYCYFFRSVSSFRIVFLCEK